MEMGLYEESPGPRLHVHCHFLALQDSLSGWGSRVSGS